MLHTGTSAEPPVHTNSKEVFDEEEGGRDDANDFSDDENDRKSEASAKGNQQRNFRTAVAEGSNVIGKGVHIVGKTVTNATQHVVDGVLYSAGKTPGLRTIVLPYVHRSVQAYI